MTAAVAFVRRNAITIAGLSVLIIIAAVAAASGLFSSRDNLEMFLSQAGIDSEIARFC